MKIGIYTFSIANNYGAVLQAFALKQYLQIKGHDAGCIDYRPDYLAAKYKIYSFKEILFNPSGIKSKIKAILNRMKNNKKSKAFDVFRTKLSLIAEDEACNQDLIILGSDQIWNISLTHNDSLFWGNLPYESKRIITYAASAEGSLEAENQTASEGLNKLNAISVRESSLQSQLVEKFSKASTVVCDPTFLLDKKQWMAIEEPYPVKRPFILVYIFGVKSEQLDIIYQFAESENLEVVILGSSKLLGGKKYASYASPLQFVYLFHHASYVITNSFHGTAFSAIFGKPVCILKKKTNERIESLIKRCEAETALTDTLCGINKKTFANIHMAAQMEVLIEQSKLFLNNQTIG